MAHSTSLEFWSVDRCKPAGPTLLGPFRKVAKFQDESIF